MDLSECYRLLGISADASLLEVKSAYRRLARQWHPDMNPHNRNSNAQFIRLTEAYQFLAQVLANPDNAARKLAVEAQKPGTTVIRVTKEGSSPPSSSSVATHSKPLSEYEKQLKRQSYQSLQMLLKSQRFARAIALIEGLVQRLPYDADVRQWQAITYHQQGRQLVQKDQLEKARIYLKKALKADPHNRSLWSDVERDFRKIEQKL